MTDLSLARRGFSRPATPSRRWRPMGSLTTWVRSLLVAGTVACLIPAYLAILQLDAVARTGTVDEGLQVLGIGDLYARWLGALVLLFAVIAVGRWIYVAHSNARVLGARSMGDGPWAAIGWFFVPIANLFRPFQLMVGLSRASRDPANWRGQPVHAAVSVWWAVWLLSNLSNALSSAMIRVANEPDAWRLALRWDLVSSSLAIACCVATLVLVSQITASLEQARQRGLGPPQPPTPE